MIKVSITNTHWSLIYAAAQDESYQGERALDVVMGTYGPAMFAYARSYTWRTAFAGEYEDWVQSFIKNKFLENNLLKKVNHRNGKFRSYLFTCLRNFLLDKLSAAIVQRENLPKVALNEALLMVAQNEKKGAEIFHHEWIKSVCSEALEKTKKHFKTKGKLIDWEIFHCFTWLPQLEGYKHPSAADLAEQFECTSKKINSANDAVKRIFRECLYSVVSTYISRDESVESELRELMSILLRMEEKRKNKRTKPSD